MERAEAAYNGVPEEALAAAQAAPAQPSNGRARRPQATPARPVHTAPSQRPAFGPAAVSEATVHGQPRHADRPAAAERPRRARPAASGQRHQIECTECGQTAEVRFQPDPTRPVYCDGCFEKRARRNRRPSAAPAQA